MSKKSFDLRNSGRPADSELAGALLKILAAGVAGGALLIGGAAKAGEFIAGKLESAAGKLEEQRAAYKEAAGRIEAAETGAFIDGDVSFESEEASEAETDS